MGSKRTISDVERRISDWIEEAGRTLKGGQIPAEVRALSKRVGAWPDMVRDPAEAFGWDKATVRPAAPTPAALDRLDTVLGWMLQVPAEHRPVLAAKMHGFSFGKIAMIDPKRRTPQGIRKAYWAGVNYIFRSLWEEDTKSRKRGLSELSKFG